MQPVVGQNRVPRKCHRALLIVEGQGRKSWDPLCCTKTRGNAALLAPPVSLNVPHLIGSQLRRAHSSCPNPSLRLGVDRPQTGGYTPLSGLDTNAR